MGERQVTVDGVSFPQAAPRPFLVLATQNPIEYEGTFPLPEARKPIRFLFKVSLGYLSAGARGRHAAEPGDAIPSKP